MGFNCKDTPTLISLQSIIDEARKISGFDEDPANTVWYIESDSQLAVMVHPAHGIAFYNDQMDMEGFCDLDCIGELEWMLDNYGIDKGHPVWREIGIDQVDFHFVS